MRITIIFPERAHADVEMTPPFGRWILHEIEAALKKGEEVLVVCHHGDCEEVGAGCRCGSPKPIGIVAPGLFGRPRR